MPLLWMMLVLMIASEAYLMRNAQLTSTATDAAVVETLCRSLLTYRAKAAEFARSNPTFTGHATDSVLNLPGWFIKPSGMKAYVTGGISYSYYPNNPNGLLDSMIRATESVQVGVKTSGKLVSPKSAQTSILLPSAIPEGAIVVLN